MKKENIPQELQDRIEAELLAGEELRWVGQPDPRRMMFDSSLQPRSSPIVTALTAAMLVLFLGVGVAWGTAAIAEMAAIGYVGLMAAVFALMIAIAVMGNPVVQHFRAKRTIYAITDRRALILSGKTVRSFGREDIELIERKMGRGSQGDLIFKYDYRKAHGYYGLINVQNLPVGFFGIENVRAVEGVMLETFRSAEQQSKRKNEAATRLDVDQAADDAIQATDFQHNSRHSQISD